VTATIIDGNAIGKAIREELKADVEGLKAKGIIPGLTVVIVGGTVEDVGFDKRVAAPTVAAFARGALERFPRLRGLGVIRTWAGLRPASPDHKPIIQLLDEPAGFCLATGHSRRGICYAAGTGRLVTDLLTGRAPFLALETFGLGRFANPEEGA